MKLDGLDFSGIAKSGSLLQGYCHGAAVASGWWNDLTTGVKLTVDVPQKLMLTVSELAEGMEGHRKNLMDDKLPHRKMLEVEPLYLDTETYSECDLKAHGTHRYAEHPSRPRSRSPSGRSTTTSRRSSTARKGLRSAAPGPTA
jgi:hypothetical protein